MPTRKLKHTYLTKGDMKYLHRTGKLRTRYGMIIYLKPKKKKRKRPIQFTNGRY